MKIDLSYGSGGRLTTQLINEVFVRNFDNAILRKMEDAAVVELKGKMAYTTDSFVVEPLFFKGGDIGKLAVCGTVNDLLMMGALPKYLTVGMIIEEGAEIEMLERIAKSMALAAKEAKVKIVAGDTKVIEGTGGIYINTSGIGEVQQSGISIANCKPGDALILSGNLGEHHAAIMSERMEIDNDIASDCAPLVEIVSNLLQNKITIHCMRDVTRGGLATVLNEAAEQSQCAIEIEEEKLPVSSSVKGFAEILGLDPLYLANEGKMIIVVPAEQAKMALSIVRSSKYGKDAKIIGKIKKGQGVTLLTKLKGQRIIEPLYGESLPRIC